jgi:thioredoxin-dependent peroxiredoxin
MGTAVKEGDRAPDFSLEAQDGRGVSLHDFAGSKHVVLYFYPKDFTMGCKAEAKAFGESYEALRSLGAEVLGVSSDTVESHARFAAQCNVGFPMLSDGDGKVRDAYGAKGPFGVIPGRTTFVIDREGIIRRVFSSQVRPRQHVAEAIEALKTLDSKDHSGG